MFRHGIPRIKSQTLRIPERDPRKGTCYGMGSGFQDRVQSTTVRDVGFGGG